MTKLALQEPRVGLVMNNLVNLGQNFITDGTKLILDFDGDTDEDSDDEKDPPDVYYQGIVWSFGSKKRGILIDSVIMDAVDETEDIIHDGMVYSKKVFDTIADAADGDLSHTDEIWKKKSKKSKPSTQPIIYKPPKKIGKPLSKCITDPIIWVVVYCPFVWFFISNLTKINHSYGFPSQILWAVYSIVMISIVLDLIINYQILNYSRVDLILDGMLGDFLCINSLLMIFLLPFIYTSIRSYNEAEEDDEHMNTLKITANMFNNICLICITTSNVLMHRMVEKVMITAAPDLYDSYIFKQTFPRSKDTVEVSKATVRDVRDGKKTIAGDDVEAGRTLSKTHDKGARVALKVVRKTIAGMNQGGLSRSSMTTTAMKAGMTIISDFISQDDKVKAASTITTKGKADSFKDCSCCACCRCPHCDKCTHCKPTEEKKTEEPKKSNISDKPDVLDQIQIGLQLIESLMTNFNTKTATGKMRLWITLKMLIQVMTSTLFTLYCVCYIGSNNSDNNTVSNINNVFTLFLSILFSLRNIAGANAIKVHDDVTEAMFQDSALQLGIGIGSFNGTKNVQYIFTTVMTAGNVLYRILSVNKII